MRWYDSLWLQKVGLATPWSSVLAETFMSQCMKLCQCFHIKSVFSWTFIYGESLHVRSCLRLPFSFLLKFYKPVTWLGWDLRGSEIKGGPRWGSRESGVTFSSSMLLSPIKEKACASGWTPGHEWQKLCLQVLSFLTMIWFGLIQVSKSPKQPLSQKSPLAFRHAGVCAGVARAARFESSDPQTLKPSNRSWPVRL